MRSITLILALVLLALCEAAVNRRYRREGEDEVIHGAEGTDATDHDHADAGAADAGHEPPVDGADGGHGPPAVDPGTEELPPPAGDAGHEAPPADAGHEAPPADAGHEAAPADAGHEAVPADAGHEAAPADAGGDHPAMGGEQEMASAPAAGGEHGESQVAETRRDENVDNAVKSDTALWKSKIWSYKELTGGAAADEEKRQDEESEGAVAIEGTNHEQPAAAGDTGTHEAAANEAGHNEADPGNHEDNAAHEESTAHEGH